MAIVIQEPFPKDLPSIDRQLMIKALLAEWQVAGYVPENKRSFLLKLGYDPIDDWAPENIAFADGFTIAFVPDPLV